jgi:hypothetical protein
MQAQTQSTYVFTLTADAAPGLLPRVLNPFAKRDVMPDSVVAERGGDACHVTVVCNGLDPVDARLIRADLLRLVGLRTFDAAGEATRLAA